jgi:hypothetical protein
MDKNYCGKYSSSYIYLLMIEKKNRKKTRKEQREEEEEARCMANHVSLCLQSARDRIIDCFRQTKELKALSRTRTRAESVV